MNEGRAQHRAAAHGRRHPGNHFNLHLGVLLAHLIDEAAHAIDPPVAGADHGDCLLFHGLLEGQLTPLRLLGHGGGEEALAGEMVPDQVHINRIAHNHLGLPEGVRRPDGHLLIRPGADAHNHHFLHRTILISFSAAATVTPFAACFFTKIRPPPAASTAARSHTLSAPVTDFTNSEEENSPWARRRVSAA